MNLKVYTVIACVYLSLKKSKGKHLRKCHISEWFDPFKTLNPLTVFVARKLHQLGNFL